MRVDKKKILNKVDALNQYFYKRGNLKRAAPFYESAEKKAFYKE